MVGKEAVGLKVVSMDIIEAESWDDLLVPCLKYGCREGIRTSCRVGMWIGCEGGNFLGCCEGRIHMRLRRW